MNDSSKDAYERTYELGSVGSPHNPDYKDAKGAFASEYDPATADIHDMPPRFSVDDGTGTGTVTEVKATDQAVISSTALHVDDDPSLSPWTFRFWFLGLGLSLFSAVLATIYTFKPQQLSVSVIFLAVISYALGEMMSLILPRKGAIGKWLNPFPFNSKEHTAIVIMSSSAATCALATEILAAQRLYYPTSPSGGAAIFMLFSSQLLGYGIAGLNRGSLINKRKLVYPSVLPMNTLIETLHRDKKETAARLKFFWIVFACIFCWETIPEYIMPILTGVSIFCLAKRDSLVFTNVFGGSNGNEGLGVGAMCFDWQYIGSSCLYFPIGTLLSGFTGYCLCICLFCGAYYGNLWRAQDFPFLSQLLFTGESNSTNFVQFNQSLVLDSKNELVPSALEAVGIPYFTPTYMLSILTNNLAITATFTHMILWDWPVMKTALATFSIQNAKRWIDFKSYNWKFWQTKNGLLTEEELEDPELDPHYRLMAPNYSDVPNSWYVATLVFSILVALICIYVLNSTLPWWGFFIALLISYILTLFTGAMYGISGFAMPIQPLVQMVGGYMHPGKPLANMYFTLFGYNTVGQAQLLLRDLKLAQYAHLSPKATFTSQMVGTLLGCVLNYVMMQSITTNQREILLSIEGTNVWSGQVIQSWNSQATAWGGLAKYLFSSGARYQFVSWAVFLGFLVPIPFWAVHRFFPKLGFNNFNAALICWYLGYLCVGINSSVMFYFAIGFATQYYVRRKYPAWYLKYNYLLSAGLDGGTQVIVFILSFAVFGSSGKQVDFPPWVGNNFQEGNYDFCMRYTSG